MGSGGLLDRAPACRSRGRWFDSTLVHYLSRTLLSNYPDPLVGLLKYHLVHTNMLWKYVFSSIHRQYSSRLVLTALSMDTGVMWLMSTDDQWCVANVVVKSGSSGVGRVYNRSAREPGDGWLATRQRPPDVMLSLTHAWWDRQRMHDFWAECFGELYRLFHLFIFALLCRCI